MLEQLLQELAVADEKQLYRILSLLPRSRKRKFLKKVEDVVNGKSDMFKGVSSDLSDKIKNKFTNILNHYDYGRKNIGTD